MKFKLILFSILAIPIMLSGCGKADIREKYQDIPLSSGVYENKDWDNDDCTYQNHAVPDKETAISVAQAIYEGMTISEDLVFEPYSVFYDEEEEIWIVTFCPDVSYPAYDIVFAIKKSDGQILKIWMR